MSMIYKLLDNSDNKLSIFIKAHLSNQKEFFELNGQNPKQQDFVNFVYYYPFIFNYLCDLGVFKEFGLQPNKLLDNFIHYNYKYFFASAKNNNIGKNVKKVFSNIIINDKYVNTRYGKLKLLVSNDEPFFIDSNFSVKIVLNDYPYHKISLGNILFLTSIPSVTGLVKFLYDYAQLEKLEYMPRDYSFLALSDKMELMCYILNIDKLVLLQKTRNDSNIINNIITNFSNILCMQKRYLISNLERLKKRILNDKTIDNWDLFYSNEEIKSYRQFLNKVCSTIKRDVLQKFKNYDSYLLEDVPLDEHNKYKLDFEMVAGIHPDYQAFKFLMSNYIRWMNIPLGKSLDHLYFYIEKFKLTSKLLYLREVLKNVSQEFDIYWKNNGFINLYNIETCLGYRCDKLKLQEIEKQYEKNFFSNNDRNGYSQKEFFKKWFNYAINFRKAGGKSLLDIVKENNNRNRLKEMYPNKHLFFDAPGACEQKIVDDKGRKHNMSKTQYFSGITDIDALFDRNYHVTQLRDSIVVKHETVKDRIVVNTGLDTYIPLCKIEYLLSKSFKGFEHCYALMSKESKNILHGRFCKYLLYNKFSGNRYLCLPLDYSSFDTTITFDLILQTLRSFAKLTIYSEELLYNIDLFEKLMVNRQIEFKQFGKIFKYKYGVLSGWKITNLVESLLNFVISYGVIGEMELNLADIITMGDDLVIVLDMENVSLKKQQQLLKLISNNYAKLGFVIHPIKNMIGYDCIEFLRNYYNCNIARSYPIRSLIPIIYQQPTAELEYNNYSNYKATLDKMILKLGIFSKIDDVYKLMNLSTNSNIAEHGYDCSTTINRYNVENKIVYEYKVNNRNIIINSQLYKHYIHIFGVNQSNIIYTYLKNNVFSKKVAMETISPKRKFQRLKDNANSITVKLKMEMVKYFFQNINLDNIPDYRFNVGDYHLNMIIEAIIEKKKYINKAVLFNLIDDYDNISFISKQNMKIGISLLNWKNYNLILQNMKIRTIYSYYNHALISVIVDRLQKTILYYRLNNKFRFLRSKNGFRDILNLVLGDVYSAYNYIYVQTSDMRQVPVLLFVD